MDIKSLEDHVKGNDSQSGVTSWTTKRKQALRFSGRGGTIIEVDPATVVDRVVRNPLPSRYPEEHEVLLKGTIIGKPTKP